MTVSSSTNRDDYSGNGSTTVFTVNFKFIANSHIRVIHKDATNIETVWAETTDYTLTGAGNPTGTLTAVTAPATGETITILRNVPQTQETDYVENDSFPADTHETALDKLTMQVQQLDERFDRLITLPETSTGTNLSFEAPVSGEYLQWKSDLSGLQNVASIVGTVPVTTFMQTFVDDNTGQEGINTLGLTGTLAEYNKLDGLLATQAELDILDGVTADAAEINLLENATSTDISTSGLQAGVINLVYPVGSIYISTVATNPGTLLGVGVWAATGVGRMLIGVGTSDAAYALDDTGGESTTNTSHTHTYSGTTGLADANSTTVTPSGSTIVSTTAHEHLYSGTTSGASTTSETNLSPYLVVHMWERTS